MNRRWVLGLAAIAFVAALAGAQPEGFVYMTPTEEHEWLQKFVGEWESESKMWHSPDAEPMTAKGSESTRALNRFWIVAEGKSEVMGQAVQSVLTLGYDVKKEKYVGTWIDSMTGYLWLYEGTVNDAGTTLTLESEGPGMDGSGTTTFREVTEFLSDDHRVFRSSYKDDEGEWVKIVEVHYRRVSDGDAIE
jgi:hypothetical protein